MIERMVPDQMASARVVVMHCRWRALDENHDALQREWKELILYEDLPEYIKLVDVWYEDKGGLLSDA